MKFSSKTLFAGVAFAAAFTFATGAQAAVHDISHAPVALQFLDNTTDFGASFTNNQMGNTFADKFTFSIGQDNVVESYLSSISSSSKNGLDITDFSIHAAGGSLIAQGSQDESGAIDLWTIYGVTLKPGSYYLQVSGSVVSNTGGSFGANVNLTPVPEPETYGMMLGGLAVLGALARRRQAKLG